jgi:hypothetical protein
MLVSFRLIRLSGVWCFGLSRKDVKFVGDGDNIFLLRLLRLLLIWFCVGNVVRIVGVVTSVVICVCNGVCSGTDGISSTGPDLDPDPGLELNLVSGSSRRPKLDGVEVW